MSRDGGREIRFLDWCQSIIEGIYGALTDIDADHIKPATSKTGRHARAELAEAYYRYSLNHNGVMCF